MVAPYCKSNINLYASRLFGRRWFYQLEEKTMHAMQLFIYVNAKTPYDAQQKEKLMNAKIKLEVEALPLIVAVHIDPRAGLDTIPSHHDSKKSAPHGTDCADNLVTGSG